VYNLRYHIASLVSVFLALALGLVLGGLIVERSGIDAQPRVIVESLRKEFTALRTENAELSDENEQLQALSAEFIDAWGKDKLAGQTLVIVTNAGRESGLSSAREAIQTAGGEVVLVTIREPGFGLTDDATRAEVESLAPDPVRPLESIATSLAAEWFQPVDERPLTDAMVEAGAITVVGPKEPSVATGLLDLAAPNGKTDPAGIALASAAQSAGVKAVGGQTQNRDTGVAAAAVELGMSGFDTLGSELGRYTLVALFSGADTGYYGVASGADALFPPVVLP
jgi:hypothetical protein